MRPVSTIIPLRQQTIFWFSRFFDFIITYNSIFLFTQITVRYHNSFLIQRTAYSTGLNIFD